jgi:hypothetical protein
MLSQLNLLNLMKLHSGLQPRQIEARVQQKQQQQLLLQQHQVL